MKLNTFLATAILASIGFGTANAAKATVFYFKYNAGGYVAYGELQASEIRPDIPGYGLWYVTSISGLANGETITGLSDYALASQLLFYYPVGWLIPFFDTAGISWTTNTNAYNVYSNGNGYSVTDQNTTPDGSNTYSKNFLVPNNGTLTVSAGVPEPATWVLFGIGFLGLANAKRRAVNA